MKSIWVKESKIESRGALEGDIKVPVAIVGGGMAGLLIAHTLHERGIECAVLEAGKIAHGVTANTTAKITAQHGLIYARIIKEKGKEQAEQYLHANLLAISEFNKLSKKYDFDFEPKSAYVYSTTGRESVEKEVQAVQSLGFPAEFQEKISLPVKTRGAVRFPHQAQMNPLKLVEHISKPLTIFENTKVEAIEKNVIHTNLGLVRAEKIIIATHFPFINAPGFYFLKMYQHRSYVLALSDAPQISGMFLDEAIDGLSFRNYKNLLLLGGGDHRTGKGGGGYRELTDTAKRLYPSAKIVASWATQDCMTLDSIPYIGHYSKKTPDMFVATGFNKWGMTGSMVGALILADLIEEKSCSFADVFNPHRFSLSGQFFANMLETTGGLINFGTKRCAHLGCALKYNKQERTWDCPCHGSRYEENGKLINNPANRGLHL